MIHLKVGPTKEGGRGWAKCRGMLPAAHKGKESHADVESHGDGTVCFFGARGHGPFPSLPSSSLSLHHHPQQHPSFLTSPPPHPPTHTCLSHTATAPTHHTTPPLTFTSFMPKDTLSFVDVRFIAYNKNPNNTNTHTLTSSAADMAARSASNRAFCSSQDLPTEVAAAMLADTLSVSDRRYSDSCSREVRSRPPRRVHSFLASSLGHRRTRDGDRQRTTAEVGTRERRDGRGRERGEW
jgi:hypothetical protein